MSRLARARERLIVALDLETAAHAIRIARRLHGLVQTVKIGSILFTHAGPAIIRRVQALGFDVMLDLKFFDIPSTVERSVRAATAHRIRLLTVHALGGRAMLKAAVHAAQEEARHLRLAPPMVLGVTVLTSVGGQSSRSRLTRQVLALAKDAAAAGCGGVVASAQEARRIRQQFGPRLKVVCPGIRPSGSLRGDQVRVMNPRQALEAGADALVIGRPITGATDPAKAVQQILKEMVG